MWSGLCSCFAAGYLKKAGKVATKNREKHKIVFSTFSLFSLGLIHSKNVFSQSTEESEELRRPVRHSCEGGNRSITDVSPFSSCVPSAPYSSSVSATLKTGFNFPRSPFPQNQQLLLRDQLFRYLQNLLQVERSGVFACSLVVGSLS